MICQFCETEYPAGTERCADCGTELVEALPPESSELVLDPLETLHRHRELELLVERLEAAAIPYAVHAGTALHMQDMQALTDRVRRSQWEARVLVVSSRYDEAKAALAEVARRMLDEPDEAEESEEEESPQQVDRLGRPLYERIEPR
jgi:hypothetical protein